MTLNERDSTREAVIARRVDTVINVDFGGREIEHLYEATRELFAEPLVLAAARQLASVQRGRFVVVATGSVSRAWISPRIGENDGPAGAAALSRSLALGLGVVPVVCAERSLLRSIGKIFQAAGFSLVTLDQARAVQRDGTRLMCAVLLGFPVTDAEAAIAAPRILDALSPALLFATERAGRNSKGKYHSATGRDFGMGRARIDLLFEEASRRGIPTVAVGDGGNEIGMGLITDAVKRYIPFGASCNCGCGDGIAAVTKTDVLVTAGCSNWGCYGIAACFAALLKDERLLHPPELETRLLNSGVEYGLINSSAGNVTPDVDGMPVSTHVAVTTLVHHLGLQIVNS